MFMGIRPLSQGGRLPLIGTRGNVNNLVPTKGDSSGEKKVPALSSSFHKLRAIELSVAQGDTVAESCRKAAINVQTYYRWRSRYGGMTIAEAKENKRLREENTRLKKVVADQALDNQVL